MKIIFSSYDSMGNVYYSGGGAIATHEIAKRFVAQGHQAKVLTGAFPGSKDQVKDGVEYHYLGPSWFGPKLGQLWFQLQLISFVQKADWDIWYESFTPPFSTFGLQRFTKKPVVGIAHNLYGQVYSKRYHLLLAWLEKTGLSSYRNLVLLTQKQKAFVKRIAPNASLSIIPNGVEKELLSLPPKPGMYWLYIGRLDRYQKGLDLLLEAFSKVSTKRDLPLYIAGSGITKEVAAIKSLVARLGLNDRVRFLGKIEKRAKALYLQRAYGLIVPSRYESQGIVMLEAKALGKPILCFDLPDFEWAGESGMVRVPAFNIASLSQAIAHYSNNKRDYRRLLMKAKGERTQIASWDQVAIQYALLFKLAKLLTPSEK